MSVTSYRSDNMKGESRMHHTTNRYLRHPRLDGSLLKQVYRLRQTRRERCCLVSSEVF